MRACKDCKHYVDESDEFAWGLHMCVRAATTYPIYDFIHGVQSEGVEGKLKCYEERRNGQCGIDAIYFEPKP